MCIKAGNIVHGSREVHQITLHLRHFDRKSCDSAFYACVNAASTPTRVNDPQMAGCQTVRRLDLELQLSGIWQQKNKNLISMDPLLDTGLICIMIMDYQALVDLGVPRGPDPILAAK